VIERSNRRFAGAKLAHVTRSLLDASTLCAISTVAERGRAHVNTAYFAWTADLDLVWLSHPRAKHSQNVRRNGSVAIAVFDSAQSWGKPDHGIQVLGSAEETEDEDLEAVYAARFADYRRGRFSAYRFYVCRPRRVKLFDERELGAATFVTARVGRDGALTWERTERYRSKR
jgi:uncharacterized protein YhbP (UPF0306 family)